MTPFFKNYINEIQYALWTVDTTELKKAAEIIETTANHGGTIYVCGNALKDFINNLNKINNKFILVTGDCDETIPNDVFTEMNLLNLLNQIK